MKKLLLVTIACGALAAPASALQPAAAPQRPEPRASTVAGELGLYELADFNGAAVSVARGRTHVQTPWNIRSVAVHPGERWQICAQTRYRDPCIVLDRSVRDARMIGVEGQIGSARLAPAPPAQ